jgi:hypothetical protein
MSRTVIWPKNGPEPKSRCLWGALPYNLPRDDLRERVQALRQAIRRYESTQSNSDIYSALSSLAVSSRRSGYDGLACICRDILERIEDSQAAGLRDTMLPRTFTQWMQYVEEYLHTPLRPYRVFGLIHAHERIWSRSPLCRADRVLLVRALRRGGR